MKKWFIIFLVCVLALLPAFLFGLSEEEKEILPELSKAVLIEIILTYDQGLTDSEKIVKKLEKSLTKLRILQEKSTVELKIQEDLFLKSLQLQEEIKAKSLKDKIVIGIGSFLAGYLTNEIIQ